MVSGLDLAKDTSDAVKSFLKRALCEHQILLFREQDLDEDQQVRFAQIFGSCRVQWQSPHFPSRNEFAHYLSNVNLDGLPIGIHPDPDSTYWHSDGSWSARPPRATVLYGLRVPEAEGATHFANTYRLYDSLDAATKGRLENLQAEHDVDMSRATRHQRMPWQWCDAARNGNSLPGMLNWWRKAIAKRLRNGAVFHPVVRSHPETRRPTLFIGDHAWRIADMSLRSGIRLMKEINSLEFESAALYTHDWQAGDLLVWDNASVLHKVGTYSISEQVRIMRRCVVLR
jgi:alpha-ketoglutarate-dependent taurine dioxygenase